MMKNVNGVDIEMTPEEISAFEAERTILFAPVTEDYRRSVQATIDEAAQSKMFNDGVTLASYIGSTVDPWAKQAKAFVAWRDDVWQYAYSELAKVDGGVRAQPSVADFLAELPEIVWP